MQSLRRAVILNSRVCHASLFGKSMKVPVQYRALRSIVSVGGFLTCKCPRRESPPNALICRGLFGHDTRFRGAYMSVVQKYRRLCW